MSLKNFCSVGSAFIAALTTDIFERDRQCLMVHLQCFPSFQLALSSLDQYSPSSLSLLCEVQGCNASSETPPRGFIIQSSAMHVVERWRKSEVKEIKSMIVLY